MPHLYHVMYKENLRDSELTFHHVPSNRDPLNNSQIYRKIQSLLRNFRRYTTRPRRQRLAGTEVTRLYTPPMEIPEHEDAGSFHTRTFLYELTVSLIFPEGSHQRSISVGMVMLSHNFLNCFCRLLGVVEWNRRYEMV